MELLHAEALQQASEEIRQQATRYALLNDELISERNEAARKLAALSATHAQAIKDLTSDRDLARTKNAALQTELNQLRQQVCCKMKKCRSCSRSWQRHWAVAMTQANS
jgi:flagellar hook-length control protein FliK